MNKFSKGNSNEFRRQGPDANEVEHFHNKSDVDSSPLAQHHTLGFGTHQAAPGNLVETLMERVAALEEGGGGGGPSFTPRFIHISRANDSSHLSGSGGRDVTGFDTLVKNINWPDYDLANGILTIPEDGVYNLFVHVRFPSPTSSAQFTHLSITGNSSIIILGNQLRSMTSDLETSGSIFLETGLEIAPYIYTGSIESIAGNADLTYQVFTAVRVA